MIRYGNTPEQQNTAPAALTAGLTPDQRTRLAQITGRIKGRHRLQIQSILDTGTDLLKAKEMLGHGAFLEWLEDEFDWTRQTAFRYMNAATHYGSKCHMVLHLNPTAIYELAAPSTPDEVRYRLVKRLEKGERVTADQVKELASKAKGVSSQVATKPQYDGVEVMDEPHQPSVAIDAKPIEIDGTAERMHMVPKSSETVFSLDATGALNEADKPGQPAQVSEVAERIRQRRQDRIVSLLIAGLGDNETSF